MPNCAKILDTEYCEYTQNKYIKTLPAKIITTQITPRDSLSQMVGQS